MAPARIISLFLVLLCSAHASGRANDCVDDSSGTCHDATGLLQNKVQVENAMADGIGEEKVEEEEEEMEQVEEQEVEEAPSAKVVDEDVEPVQPPPLESEKLMEVLATSNSSPGSTSVCGAGEEIISTNCLGQSLVKEQARATARMMMGGCCTAWLVKAEDANRGALMLSTGHCGSKATATFNFDYVGRCANPAVPASQMKSCNGKRLSVEAKKDEQAIYELDKGCQPANAATPILLDIGRPDMDEGMYILGHPNCRPSLLSHQEAHDQGQHCEFRRIAKWSSGSHRVSYYCDTQGGNSGSPVFSARTGYAIAIHSHGGCKGNVMSTNWGGLLGDNPGVIAAFNQFGIPYVNRKDVNLFQYEKFEIEATCPDHAQNTELKQMTLTNCKKMCVGSLTCVGIEYSPSAQTCSINYRSTKKPASCAGDAEYHRRKHSLTTSLMNEAPPPPPPKGTCSFETMSSPECKLWSNTGGDNFDWTVASKTPSGSTGPSKAASGSKFLYIEVSSPRQNNDKAVYKSGQVTFGAAPSISFDYHMYGSNIGELKLEIPAATGGPATVLWSAKGNKGNKWLTAKVSMGAYVGKDVTLQFTGSRGNGWAGDIALDNLFLEKGGQAPQPTKAPTTQAPTLAPTSQAPPTPAPTTLAPSPTTSSTPAMTTQAPVTPAPSPAPGDLAKKVSNLEKKMNEIMKIIQSMVSSTNPPR